MNIIIILFSFTKAALVNKIGRLITVQINKKYFVARSTKFQFIA